MSSPTLRIGDVMVVFDGARRLRWRDHQGVISSRWRCGPMPCSKASCGRTQREAPLLAIVDHDRCPVTFFSEEITELPEGLVPFLQRDELLTDLYIPLFDWLPESVRARAESFVRQVQAQQAAIPRPPLPDLITEDASVGPVRIGVRTSPRPLYDCDLTAITQHLFGRGGHAPSDTNPADTTAHRSAGYPQQESAHDD